MSAIVDAIVDAAHGHLPPGFAQALAPIIGELDDRLHAVETWMEREAARTPGAPDVATDTEGTTWAPAAGADVTPADLAAEANKRITRTKGGK